MSFILNDELARSRDQVITNIFLKINVMSWPRDLDVILRFATEPTTKI